MEDSLFLLLLAVFLIARGVACFLLLVALGICYAVYRFRYQLMQGFRSCAKFLAWQWSPKHMRAGIALAYGIVFTYTSMFVSGTNLPANYLQWAMCVMLWPLSTYALLKEVHDYSRHIAPFAEAR